MLDFLRTRALPWGVWLAAMGGAGWLYLGLNSGSANGFVEAASYGVNAPQTGRIATLNVEIGQSVKRGDVIATLDATDIIAELEVLTSERERIEAELAAQATSTQVRMSVANRGVEESIDAADLAYKTAKAERKVQAAELAALDKQIALVKDLVDKRMADRRELSELSVSHAALKKELQQADALIRQLQRQAGSARSRRGDVPADATVRVTEPLRAELAVVDRQEQLLSLRREQLTLRAPGDGEVTAVLLRAGEVATEGAPIVTISGPATAWRAGTPTIRVCVDEEQGGEIAVGEAVELRAVGAAAAPVQPGQVVAVSPDVAQLPPRCWITPNIPRWGRSIYVVLDEQQPLMPGQSFTVEFLGEPTEHELGPVTQAEEPIAIPVVKPAAEATPAAAATPGDLVVPEALGAKSRFEPSGLVWLASLSRYVLVSDDTGKRKANEHAPWLFTMTADGRVDEAPLPITGLKQIRDLESIAPAPDGGLYVLSSQGFSKKGKRHKTRTLFAHVAVDGRQAKLTGKLSLVALLDAAGQDKLVALGLRDTALLEIEGMTATADGGLLLGLKAPLTESGDAIVWQMSDPEALLESGSLDAANLRLWGTIPLRVQADGRSVQGGISELLELPDRSLLLAATASTANDPKTQSGLVAHVEGPGSAGKPRVVETFPGLKPEGLARSHGGDGVVIVFDSGADVPLWVERPWPAS